MYGSLILPGSGEIYGSVRFASFAMLPVLAVLTAVYFQYRNLSPGEAISPWMILRRFAMCSLLLLAYPYLIHLIVWTSMGLAGAIFGAKSSDEFMVNVITKAAEHLDKATQRGDSWMDALDLAWSTKWTMFSLSLTKITHTVAGFMMRLVFTFLYVIGPLAIVAGVIPGSPTLSSWTSSIAQAATWNIVLSIIYRLSAAAGIQADLTADNFLVNLGAAVCFAMACLFTPGLTRMIFSAGGAGTIASLANLAAFHIGLSAVRGGVGLAQYGKEKGKELLFGKRGGGGRSGG